MVFDEQNGSAVLPFFLSEHRNGMRMACSSINRRKIYVCVGMTKLKKE